VLGYYTPLVRGVNRENAFFYKILILLKSSGIIGLFWAFYGRKTKKVADFSKNFSLF
jgi:hypothetical protein